MADGSELEPFPLGGVCAAYLGELQEELDSSFIKVSIKLVGKTDIAPRALNRLAEKLGPCLGGGKIKSFVEVCHPHPAPENTVVVTAIISTKTSAARPSALSLTSNSSQSPQDPSHKIREVLKTTVQRQNAAKKLGEEAELVPFAGFSLIEISAEEDLTTEEVCEVYIKPRTAKEKCSLVDILAQDEAEVVGAAGTIVIHSWSSPFKSIWESLEPEIKQRGEDIGNVYVWIDLLSVSQHTMFTVTPRWLTTTLCDAIGAIGSSVLVLADWKKPVPFSRLWCIWELLATIQQGTELTVIMPPSQRASFDDRVFHDLPLVIKATFDAIDSEHAMATQENDEIQILASIRDSIGFDGANLVVKDRLLEWLSDVSEATSKDPLKTGDHLATATFCFRLAKILSGGQGKHAEAEQMLRRAVDIRTVELGPTHDSTTEVQIALANVFRVQGKLSEAEVTLRRVCESMSMSKGPTHEDTLLALATLSRVLVDRGNFDEAERICVDSLAIAETKFGIKDKRTLETLVTLSQLADLRCDSDMAAQRLRKALEGFEALFGVDAIQTMNVKADLAGFLAELENFDEAEALFREASEKLLAALGSGHEWTIKATTGLAVLAKVREGLGPNYTPGKFASKNAVPSTKPPTIPEVSDVNSIATSVMANNGSNATAAASSTITGNPPSPSKKISFDPSLTASAAKAEVVEEVTEELNSLRETRHEKIKQSHAAKSSAGGAASRKHFRGWLEKLPIELSQREKERLARKGESQILKANGRKSLTQDKSAVKGRSMLLKMATGIGSSIGFVKAPEKRKSVPNLGTSFTSMSTEAVKMNKINSNWEKRYFLAQSNLKGSSLVYWLTEEDCRNGREKRGDFPLDDYDSRIFETSPFGPTAFSVSGPKGRIHLRAASVDDKQQWIDTFKAALAFRGAADKAKILSRDGEVPKSVEDNKAFFSGSFVNMDSLLGQHSVVLGTGEEMLKKSMADMSDDE